MQTHLTPIGVPKNKCLILVGGSGDPIQAFQPLADMMSSALPDYSICTFTFTQKSKNEYLLDVQTKELSDVLDKLMSNYKFARVDLWGTSMGSYSTIKALQNKKYSNVFTKVILFDPADYFIDNKIFDVGGDLTWSGAKKYIPNAPTISMELKNINSTAIIDVVHLILRNYSGGGYLDIENKVRGTDHINGCPRLNTEMVKSFYHYTPITNKGSYIEVPGIPHGFTRDGNIHKNLLEISETTVKLLYNLTY